MATESFSLEGFVTVAKDYIGYLIEGIIIACLVYLPLALSSGWPFNKRRK